MALARARGSTIVATILVLSSAPPVAAELAVTDVGPELGLPRTTTSWDVAVGELDGDGVPDVVISYHSSVVFYRNASPGLEAIFTVTGGDPHGCTIGDVDQNGLGDVYCTRGAGSGAIEKQNTLWMQTGPGSFQDRALVYGVEDPLGRGRRTTFVDIDRDPFPDLFVGNGFPRRNARPSPNRTFLDVDGAGFDERRLGLTAEKGAHCAQAVDQNRDGWEDLLICGGRLLLYRNRGGSDFREVARELGIGRRGIRSAWLADLDGNGRQDLVTVSETRVVVRPGIRGHAFGQPVYSRALTEGRWVAVGDLDGRRGLDLLIVQACVGDTNVADLLLLNRRGSWGFRSQRFPQARRGCGDVAKAVDLNGDGRDEFIVLNGHMRLYQGPVQVLTTSW